MNENVIEALKLYRSWMFKENIELYGENYWKEKVLQTHMSLIEKGETWDSLYSGSIIPKALDPLSIMQLAEILTGDFSEKDPLAEKQLVAMAVGSKGTVNVHLDTSITAKEGTLQLVMLSLKLAMQQGFITGDEITLSSVIEKLS